MNDAKYGISRAPPPNQISHDEDLFEEPLKPKLSLEEEDDLDKHGEPDFVEKPEDLESKIQRRTKQISMITNKPQAVSKVMEEVSNSPA